MRIGIDAHKRSCTTCLFEENGADLSPKESFTFETTRQEFMGRVPERSVIVIESSTTGKVLSRMLSGKYEVHMIAPPEKKLQIKTDKHDVFDCYGRIRSFRSTYAISLILLIAISLRAFLKAPLCLFQTKPFRRFPGGACHRD